MICNVESQYGMKATNLSYTKSLMFLENPIQYNSKGHLVVNVVLTTPSAFKGKFPW